MPAITQNETDAKALLKAAPVTTMPAPSSQSVMGASPIPPQNVWAGGLGAVVTWFVVYGLTNYLHVTVDPGLQTIIAGLVGIVLAWLVPPSQTDVIKVLDDDTVQKAMRDQHSAVSYVQAPVTPPPGESAVYVPPAK